MKKYLIALTLCLLAISARAEEKFSDSVRSMALTTPTGNEYVAIVPQAAGSAPRKVTVSNLLSAVSGMSLNNPAFSGTASGNATIPNSVLVNSGLTIAGHAISLGGSQNLAVADLTDGAGVAVGASSAAVDHLTCFDTTTGKALRDCTASGRTIASSSPPFRGSFSGFPIDLSTYNENATITPGPAYATSVIGQEIDLNAVSPGGGIVTNTLHIGIVSEAKLTGALTHVTGKSEDINGLFTIGYASDSQGGGVSGATVSGRAWGAASMGYLDSGATGYVSVIGHESDAILNGTADRRYAYWGVDYQSANQGATEDAAFGVAAADSSVGWRVAFGISMTGGSNPISSGGSILASLGGSVLSIANGIDLRGFSFSDASFVSGAGGGTFKVTQAGDVTLKNATLSQGFINGTAGLTIETNGSPSITINTAQDISFGAATAALDHSGNASFANLALSTGFFNGTAGITFQTASVTAMSIDTSQHVSMQHLPTSAGAGGLYVCIDTAGALYKKSACP